MSFIRAMLSVQSTMAAANSSRWLVAVLDSFQRLTKVSGMRACSTLFYACDRPTVMTAMSRLLSYS